MTGEWSVQIDPDDLRIAADYLSRDPESVAELFAATDALAADQRPAEARPWGENRFRLHTGHWRVVYELDDDNRLVTVIHIGRTEPA